MKKIKPMNQKKRIWMFESLKEYGLIEDIYQDKKKLSTFLDRMTDWYEDEIIEIISDKIVEGRI